jgi:hypothetical protein
MLSANRVWLGTALVLLGILLQLVGVWMAQGHQP